MPTPDISKSATGKELAQSLEDHLKELITRGILAPGQRVTEADVIKDTGASRSRVRQAFQRLAADGIMIIEEFRGASVKRLSKSEIIQLYEVREMLEGLAARLSAKHASAKSRNNLTRLQSKMDSSEEAGDSTLFTQLNNQWHQEITDSCGNTYVTAFMNRLNVPLNRLLLQFFLKPDEIATANRDHREITQAITEGSVETAEKLMRRHIRSGFNLRRIRNAPDLE